ncbi:hypothetical protein KCP71_15655 [Salmonella enterica subsp. enterica]|nr:hypothetical protein KCP71_15655 [Salmonella enterica subsp. enterica]
MASAVTLAPAGCRATDDGENHGRYRVRHRTNGKDAPASISVITQQAFTAQLRKTPKRVPSEQVPGVQLTNEGDRKAREYSWSGQQLYADPDDGKRVNSRNAVSAIMILIRTGYRLTPSNPQRCGPHVLAVWPDALGGVYQHYHHQKNWSEMARQSRMT